MADAGDTITDPGNIKYSYYVTLVSITILCYDFLLTFPSEVERYWIIGRLNCASCLFYLNRYGVLLAYIPILMESFWVTHDPSKLQICRQLKAYHQYISTLIQAVIAAMLIMRIYALYRRNIRILIFFVVIAAALLAVACWAGFGGKSEPLEDVLFETGCGVSTSHYRALRMAISWTAQLAFDLLVFGMTLYRILTLPRMTHSNLLTIFMWDGAMYFGVMTISTLMNILLLLVSDPLTRDIGMSFTNTISSVMMTRMMLNIRDPSLVPATIRTATETVTFPNLTLVESHYPTEISGGGFEDDYSIRGLEAVDSDQSRSSGTVIELHRIGV
ncbi:hypothetical protein BYT27DRAFT_7201441 [Phlegmacium glaucopus]|nr:hypothetical protein BYT27DRAFT_7201441 [Phlegmacium glaucopus]